MEVVVIWAVILGVILYFYTRYKIKELSEHINHAQNRIKGTHDNAEQHEMDRIHVQKWAETVVGHRQANLVGRIIVGSAIVLFLVVRTYEYAVAYHWFG